MLAYFDDTIWSPWTGQPRPLDGEGSYQLPRAAEAIYSDAELAAYGLLRVTPATVPDDKRIVSSTIADQNGAPIEVALLEDIPPPPTLDEIDTATLNDKLLEEGSIDRAELRAIFDHENRVRKLEGKAAITQAQFLTALKTLIR